MKEKNQTFAKKSKTNTSFKFLGKKKKNWPSVVCSIYNCHYMVSDSRKLESKKPDL